MNSNDDDPPNVLRLPVRSALEDIAAPAVVVDGLLLMRVFSRIASAEDRARVIAFAAQLASQR